MRPPVQCTVYQARRKDQIRKKKILTDHLRRTALTTNTNAKQEGSIVLQADRQTNRKFRLAVKNNEDERADRQLERQTDIERLINRHTDKEQENM